MTRNYEFWLAVLKTWSIRQTRPLNTWNVQYDGEPVRENDPGWRSWAAPAATRRTLSTHTTVPWDHASLLMDVSGETLLLVDSQPAYGLNPYHNRYRVSASAGTPLSVALEQVTTGLMGTQAVNPGISRACWADIDPLAEESYWDLAVLLEWGDEPDTPADLKTWLERALDRALAPLYAHSPDESAVRHYAGRPGRDAEEEGLFQALAEGPVAGLHPIADAERRALVADLHASLQAVYHELATKAPAGSGELVMMGHAHIDLAWLWPIAETERKIIRTAASQAHLLEHYPDWRFGMSSPEMWRLIETSPTLWERWRQLTTENRVTPLGAFWVEADSQLIGGESVLRHLLYGLRYFESTVGQRPTTAFLPDTFGFSGSLPTLLAAAGIRLFLTTKINWNDTTRFPYKNFRWIGPDGSAVQAMLFGSSPDGYNGKASIRDLKLAWQNYVAVGGEDRVLYALGHGDGGGGPDESMLERIRRYRQLPLLPKLTDDAPESLAASTEDWNHLPRYRGDLYLEYHRAVFTAQTAVKAENRAVEAALIATETWALLAGLHPTLGEAWKRFLRNHFHDILPGSSIASVYQDFHRDMAVVRAELQPIQQESFRRLVPAGSEPVLVVGHPGRFHRPAGPAVVRRDQAFQIFWENAWHPAHAAGPGAFQVELPKLPPWGVASFPLQDIDELASPLAPRRPDRFDWHSGNLTVSVGPEGIRSIASSGRELLSGPAGIAVFFQHPPQFDAWELVKPAWRGHQDLSHDPLEVIWESDNTATVRLTHRLGASVIHEELFLNGPDQRIEAAIDCAIAERRLVVQYRVPTTLVAGHVTRETLWGTDQWPTIPAGPADEARFEWAAHRFVDLAEPHQGLALVNDGRHGYAADEGILTITLATSPLFPDPAADATPAPVRLALIPHDGSWTDANIMAQAHAFSEPLQMRELTTVTAEEWIRGPLDDLPDNVALLGMKPAEDGSSDWICHLGEMWGDTVACPMRPVDSHTRVFRADLVSEAPMEPLPDSVVIGPHQLLVLRLCPEGACS